MSVARSAPVTSRNLPATLSPVTARTPPEIVALAQRWTAGDDRAREELGATLEAHRPGVRALCRRVLGDPARAEELTQDVLLKAWEKLPDYRGEAAFSSWLAAFARNVCFNAVRKRGELLSEDGLIDLADPASDALVALTTAERAELVQLAAANLDPLDQEAVYLRYVEGLPQDVITRLLQLDQRSGARGLLQTSRRRLAANLRVLLEARGLGSSFVRDGN